MSTLAEIERAIEALPETDVEVLAAWLKDLRHRRESSLSVEEWLEHAKGAAIPAMTTHTVLAETRGEE